MAQQTFSSIYDKMTFPPYKFTEYPKWVNIGEKRVLVQTQREEIALIADTPDAAKNDPVVVAKNKLVQDLSDAQEQNRKLEKQLAELRAIQSGGGNVVSVAVDPSTPIEVKPLPKAK